MYNNSGIFYRLVTCGTVLLVLSVACLLLSRFWDPVKRNKKELVIAIFFIVFAVAYNVKYIYKLNNLQVKYHEGYFVEEHRTSRGGASVFPFTHKYTFSNDSGKKPYFYLDTFSKKEIFPGNLSKNVKYRVFYDVDTDIIVRVEIIEE